MTRRLLLTGLLLLWMLPLLWALPAPAATPLSEAEVRAFVKAGDEAISVHNIGKVVAQMAPEIRVEEVRIGGKTRRYNRSQFAARMKDNYNQLPKGLKLTYRTQVDSLKITGNKAVLKTTIYERADYNGKRVNAVHTETATLEKRDGTLLITGIKAVIPAQ